MSQKNTPKNTKCHPDSSKWTPLKSQDGLEGVFKHHFSPTPMQWAGTSSTRTLFLFSCTEQKGEAPKTANWVLVSCFFRKAAFIEWEIKTAQGKLHLSWTELVQPCFRAQWPQLGMISKANIHGTTYRAEAGWAHTSSTHFQSKSPTETSKCM